MHVRGRRSFSGAAHIIATPQRLHTLLFQCFALHFFATALPCFAFAMQPLPLPFCANPARCGAWAGVAFPMQILAYPCLSLTWLCFSGALRVQALPQLCFSRRILSFAGPSFSGAERRAAIPGHFIALHCPALPLLSELRQCTVLLCYSAAPHRPATPTRYEANPCLCASWLRLSGAYPLGPLPAPFSPW